MKPTTVFKVVFGFLNYACCLWRGRLVTRHRDNSSDSDNDNNDDEDDDNNIDVDDGNNTTL